MGQMCQVISAQHQTGIPNYTLQWIFDQASEGFIDKIAPGNWILGAADTIEDFGIAVFVGGRVPGGCNQTIANDVSGNQIDYTTLSGKFGALRAHSGEVHHSSESIPIVNVARSRAAHRGYH